MAQETKTRDIGAESGHWYNEAGLVESVPSAKGDKMIKPTLRQARTLNLLPSTTTILRVIAKPNLELWRAKQYALAAEKTLRNRDESDADWLARVAATMNAANNQAQIGTNVHAEIARYLTEGIQPSPVAKKACEWLDKMGVRAREIRSETPFANRELGYGGTVDLFYTTPTENVYIDFKTTSDAKIDNITPSMDYLIQLCAYANATRAEWGGAERATKLINLYIGRERGEIYALDWTANKNYAALCIKAEQMFNAAFALWKLANNYDPTNQAQN